LHCGNQIVGSAAAPSVEWENGDFIFIFPDDATSFQVGSGPYEQSETEARIEVWARYKNRISLEFQKRADEGWQPIGSFDASGISFHEFRTQGINYLNPFGKVIMLVLYLMSFGLFAIFDIENRIKPIEFRIPIRRAITPKPVSVHQKPLSPQIGSAKLRIERESKYAMSLVNFGVYVDGEKIGEVGNGKSQTFTIKPGEHEIFVKASFNKSSKIKHVFNSGDLLALYCRPGGAGVKLGRI
jgi:hypothetical protein